MRNTLDWNSLEANISIMKKLTLLFSLSIALFLSQGCKGDEDTPAPAESWSLNNDPKFEAKVEGAKVRYTTARDVIGIEVSSEMGPDLSTFSFGTSFSDINYTRGIYITKGTVEQFGGGYITEENFVNFFEKGEVNYSVDADDGMEIVYVDADGTEWSTSNQSGDQTNSSFNFKILRDESFVDLYMKYLATFNCTLYDDGDSSIQLTDGKCIGYFGDGW